MNKWFVEALDWKKKIKIIIIRIAMFLDFGI